MFSGFTEETTRFFLDLRFHNYTEYFHAEHDRYVREVQSLFYEMIEDLAPAMLKIDEGMEVRPHKCLSRIHRDTRFSKDKSPYRDHLWFLFRHAAEPRELSLMYFFEFGPGRLNWGLGTWGENREMMNLFRRRMRANPEGTLALLDDLRLDRHQLYLLGNGFKRMEIPPEIPERLEPWYRTRELFIGKILPEDDHRIAYTEELITKVRSDFETLAPLYRLLRGYLEELNREDPSARS